MRTMTLQEQIEFEEALKKLIRGGLVQSDSEPYHRSREAFRNTLGVSPVRVEKSEVLLMMSATGCGIVFEGMFMPNGGHANFLVNGLGDWVLACRPEGTENVLELQELSDSARMGLI